MIWALISLCSLLSLISLTQSVFYLRLSALSQKTLLESLNESQQRSAQSNQVLNQTLNLLFQNQTELLNRVQAHSWTEFAQLQGITQAPSETYISPDAEFDAPTEDDFGSFEPLIEFNLPQFLESSVDA